MALLSHMAEAKALGSVKSLADIGLSQIPEAYIQPQNKRPEATPVYTENESIPVIDLQGLQGLNRQDIVKTIGKACQTWGFFQVINHGVPETVIKRMVEAYHRFFELPEEEKDIHRTPDNKNPVKHGTFHQPSNKELEWKDFIAILVTATIDDESLQCWFLVLRDAALEYVGEIKRLAATLLSAFSEALGISDSLENYTACGRLVLNHYPPCPNPELTLGVRTHSDVSIVSILLQDNVEGLQVVHNDRWVAVPPINNAFVVNVGDCLQVLSNGRFQSVEHRAVTSQNQVRISIPFFGIPDYSTVIRPIPEQTLARNSFIVPSFDMEAAAEHTAIELTGTDRPGLLSEIFAVLTHLKCNVVEAEVWTDNRRVACLVYSTDEDTGAPVEDPLKISKIEELLRNVMKGGDNIRGAKTVVSMGFTHTQRRLHQLMCADRDYEKTDRNSSKGESLRAL